MPLRSAINGAVENAFLISNLMSQLFPIGPQRLFDVALIIATGPKDESLAAAYGISAGISVISESGVL